MHARIILLLITFPAAVIAEPPATQPATTQAALKTRTTPTGLVIIDTQYGEGAAKLGDTVWVQYTGRLADGTVFDTSVGLRPFQLKIGEGRVIKGWEEGLIGMNVGDKRKLIIPPALAYGAEGKAPKIPKDATLTFDVELLALARLHPATQK
jgi:FKBP-type peptidyl-prolyl cis-trans isomerase